MGEARSVAKGLTHRIARRGSCLAGILSAWLVFTSRGGREACSPETRPWKSLFFIGRSLDPPDRSPQQSHFGALGRARGYTPAVPHSDNPLGSIKEPLKQISFIFLLVFLASPL